MAKRTPTTGTSNPPAPAGPNLLDGIEYADGPRSEPDDERPEDHRPPDPYDEPPAAAAALEDTRDRGIDGQRAAIAAMRRRALERKQREQDGRKAPRPRLPPPDPKVLEARRPELYRVLEEKTLARGASQLHLPAGKVISENDYNIPDLETRGVKLEAYTPPPPR